VMGGQEWQHVSGVPVFGSSRLFHECTGSTLQKWEDEENVKYKNNWLLKFFRQLNFKTKKSKKKSSMIPYSTLIALPKVSLLRIKSVASPKVVSSCTHDVFK